MNLQVLVSAPLKRVEALCWLRWHAWKVLVGMDCEEGDSCLEGIKEISSLDVLGAKKINKQELQEHGLLVLN